MEQMMLKLKPSEFHACVRQDLSAFIEGCFYVLNPATELLWSQHLEVIASALESCRRGETTRLIINVPPRSLKSLCTNAFVAFLLGHDPSAQIICASYAQSLADKHALDCSTILKSRFYRDLFPNTKLSPHRQSVQEFMTTRQGYRLSISVGGAVTGRGAEYVIIDDPQKADEALSNTRRRSVNDWFDNTLYSRLNDQKTGRIILVMQRLHEDDLVGHVLGLGEHWKVIRFPAIAEEDETLKFQTPYGIWCYERRAGEPLHSARESLEVLNRIRETLGEYNFASQYQQTPAPLGGGMVKLGWFKRYTPEELPSKFEQVFQSWDTANKPTELSDFSVCTTWGVVDQHVYLLDVYRKRLSYPELKSALREQAATHNPKTILVEDEASGTQLIQELVAEGVHAVQKYAPTMHKITRMNTVTSTIENGFVHVPEKAPWLGEFLHELTTFPQAKYSDQADSTSQALDWIKQQSAPMCNVAQALAQYAAESIKERYFPPSDSPLINRGALLREWDRMK
jgi:predicted phage terminase large subunit-like protein